MDVTRYLRSPQPGVTTDEGVLLALGEAPSETPEFASPIERLREIPLQQVRPNPHQPRRHFAENALADLSASIREVGVLQPVVVRQVEDGFELIAGERRWRASRMAGLDHIPAIVLDASPDEQPLLALIENVQRENLSPVEEARAIAEIIEQGGLTQSEIARRLGRSQAAVANKLRLLRLAPAVLQYLEEGRLGERQARALVGLPETDQLRLAREAVEEGFDAREMETRARRETPARPRKGNSSRTKEKEPTLLQGHEGPAGALLQELVGLVENQRRQGLAVSWKLQTLDQSRLVVEVHVALAPGADDGEQ